MSLKKQLEDDTFLDVKKNKTFKVYKVISEHITNHCRVIYMKSLDGEKQSFTDIFFEKLIQSKELIIIE